MLIAFDVLLDGRRVARQRCRMPSWSEFESQAPELAAEVRRRLDAHRHKTIATVRRDGSPRISGTETDFRDGELWIGSMWKALKALDLRRDPRFALHSGSDEPDDWDGDAKLAGVAEEVSADGKSHSFRLDLREVSTVRVNEKRDGLVITVWTPDGGVREIRRS
jgi:pyridoxamine 5'-phosphate oxidase-like protein